MNNELNPFDRTIREKLKGHEVPFDPSHWEQMEEKLSQETETPLPEAGDAILFSRLGDLEVPYDPANWTLMEELIEQDEAVTVAEFDRVAASRLHRMEAPYDPNHWELMAKQIDVAFSFRHWLHRNHVPELVLMVLFCFTLFQFLQREGLRDRFAPGRPHHHPAQAPHPGKPAPTAPLPAVVPIAQANIAQQPREFTGNRSMPGQASGSLTALGRGSISSFGPTFYLPAGVVLLPDRDGLHPATDRLAPGLEQFAKNAALTGLSSIKRFAAKPSRWYFGAFSGVDYNLIRAPMDDAFQTEGYLTDSTGMTTGIVLAVEKGKWQFQTGAAYSKVAYRPILPVQQYGTFDFLVIESFDQIRYQFLQAPFQVRRNFLPERSRWDVYALAGIQANLILHADYDINRKEFNSARSPETIDDILGQSRLNGKIFPEGILNGDNFFRNTYISLSAGAGIERSISTRYRLFAESRYARPFFGHDIGPNDDRIHQFSVQVGAKMQIR